MDLGLGSWQLSRCCCSRLQDIGSHRSSRRRDCGPGARCSTQTVLQRPSVAFLVTAAGYVVAFLFIVYVAVAMGVSDVTPSATIDSILEMYDAMAEQMSEFGARFQRLTGMMRPYLMMSIPALVCLSARQCGYIVLDIQEECADLEFSLPIYRHLGMALGMDLRLGVCARISPCDTGGLRGMDSDQDWPQPLLVFYMVFMVQGLAVIVYYFALWQCLRESRRS